jgi:drug/metabolite transporter (DMT)-like permease
MYVAPQRKDHIDAFGATALVLFSAMLGLNQVFMKLINAGMNPVFQAGLRSACAVVPVLVWMKLRGRRISVDDGTLLPGIVCGLFFAFEFLLLFQALEYTTVARTSVLFYTMPIWVSVAANFLIPGEAMTRRKAAGLLLAVAGVALALSRNEQPATERALLGDLMALAGAAGWAAVALTARVTKLSRASPEMQLLYQVAVSAPILLLASGHFGVALRGMTAFLWSLFAFQVLGVVTALYIFWFWILKVYPASEMASFAFLAPVFGVFFGWLILGEPLSATLFAALSLVGAGIWLVNRRPQAPTA